MNYREMVSRAPYEPWAADLKAEADKKNAPILASRQAQLDARVEIGVGDFVRDGDRMLRVAHHWGDSLQLADGRFGWSFYLGDGYVSFSGGLDPGIPLSRFAATIDRRLGRVWFFSENYVTGANGFDCEATFRVWRLLEEVR